MARTVTDSVVSDGVSTGNDGYIVEHDRILDTNEDTGVQQVFAAREVFTSPNGGKVVLWQRTNTPNVWKPSRLNANIVNHYLSKRRDGSRVFYTKIEVDGLEGKGKWRSSELTDNHVYRCPVASCRGGNPKTFGKLSEDGTSGLVALRNHVMGAHAPLYDIYKASIEARIKAEIGDTTNFDISVK